MRRVRPSLLLAAAALIASACSDPQSPSLAASDQPVLPSTSISESFKFTPIVPITGDAACLDRGSDITDPTDTPLQLPNGYVQTIIGRQGDFPTTNSEVNFDMLTLNETGPQAGRYLFRTHEVEPWAGLSVIDLWTGKNSLVVERYDWEGFDGLVWTPWGTILMAEEAIVQSYRDPAYPDIERGLIYEYFPRTGDVVARPAIGARSHEGMRFDDAGNLYGISESRGIANAGRPGESGSLFKFVPTRRGDLSSGQLYALRVLNGRTGAAFWEPLTLDPVSFDSDAAAQAVGATGWDRPEDIEIGRQRGQQVMFVAVTESSNLPVNNGLVLKVVLQGERAFVSNYVEPGVNVLAEVADPFTADAGLGFDDPDNLELAANGDLYIAEDDGPSDIWVARGAGPRAEQVVVFARLLDCGAESTGIYFDRAGRTLWVNSQHAALNSGNDLTIAIKPDAK